MKILITALIVADIAIVALIYVVVDEIKKILQTVKTDRTISEAQFDEVRHDISRRWQKAGEWFDYLEFRDEQQAKQIVYLNNRETVQKKRVDQLYHEVGCFDIANYELKADREQRGEE